MHTTLSQWKTAVSWLLLALATSLLRLKISLQSDALFYEALTNDILVRGGAWSDWKFSTAPGFVPDMVLYFIAFPMFSDAFSRILFVSVAQAIAFAILATLLVRTLAPARGRELQAHAVMAVAFVTLVSAQSGMWLYFHTTNNHFGSLLFGLTGTILLIRFRRRPAWPTVLLLLLVVAIATVSSKLFVLNFTLPCLMLAVALLMFYRAPVRRLRLRRAALVRLIVGLAGGQCMAIMLEKLLVHHAPSDARPPLSADMIAQSLRLFLDATTAAFSPDNYATLIFSVAMVICLLYLVVCLLRAVRLDRHGVCVPIRATGLADKNLAVIGALMCMSLALSVGGMIFSGALADEAGYRYLAFPLALAAILALVRVSLAARRPWIAQLVWLVVVLIIGGNGLHLARNAKPPADSAHAVAQCVAAGADALGAGFTLKAGIADYWNARAVSYRLAQHNPILSTIHNLTPLFWVSTLGPLKNRALYPEYHYNFAILRNSGSTVQFSYTPEMVGQLLPPPTRIVACADGATQVWLYRGNELDTTVQAAITQFMQQRKINP